MRMGHRVGNRRRGAPGGSLTQLVLVAIAGALLARAIVPAGAGGQQYSLPTTTTAAPPNPTATTPPPPVTASSLPLLTPFPIVRIVGRTTPRGAKVALLTVRAGAGSYVVSRCVGAPSRCPYKQRISRIPGRRGQLRTIHVRGFERSFRAGVVLRVYVVDVGRTGKFTSFKIRRKQSPRRNDGCVAGIVLRPVSCP